MGYARGRKPNDHKVREAQNLTNKIIREAKRLYFERLGDKLSDPQTELPIRRSLQISRPFLTTTFMLKIFSKRLNFLMIISPHNAKSMIIVSRILSLELTNPYHISRTDKSISYL